MAKAHQAKEPKDYRIILHQDAIEPLTAIFGPFSKDALIAATVGQFEDAPVDVYAPDVNTGGGVFYNSKVCEHFLTGRKGLATGRELQMLNAMQQFMDEGTDLLHLICEITHSRGVDCMLRVRTNDLHDVPGYLFRMDRPRQRVEDRVPEACWLLSRWRQAHPEYLMGDPTVDLPKSYEYWERCAPNFALGPVREYMMNMVEELVNNYDLDILELDFIRSPFHFPRLERYAQRHVMTAFVRRARQLCQEASAKRGRPIRLSVRVPDTVELCLLSGYDLPQWLAEGFLDMVSIGGGWSPFGTPWQEIVSLCKKSGVPAFACFDYGPFDSDRNLIRAAAMRAYSQGVTGIKLWNFFYCMDYYHPPGKNPLDFTFIKDIVGPEVLNGLAKTYVPGHNYIQMAKEEVGWAYSYEHVTWPGQVPLMVGLASDGVGNTVVFDVADDMASRGLEVAKLEVEVVDLGPTDELLFFFNGKPIEREPGTWAGAYANDKHHFEFTLPCSAIITGQNTLELRLLKRDERLVPFVSLEEARLLIPGIGQNGGR